MSPFVAKTTLAERAVPRAGWPIYDRDNDSDNSSSKSLVTMKFYGHDGELEFSIARCMAWEGSVCLFAYVLYFSRYGLERDAVGSETRTQSHDKLETETDSGSGAPSHWLSTRCSWSCVEIE